MVKGLTPCVLARGRFVDDGQLEQAREDDLSRSLLAELARYDRGNRVQRGVGFLLRQTALLGYGVHELALAHSLARHVRSLMPTADELRDGGVNPPVRGIN